MALNVPFPVGFFAHRLIASVNAGEMGFPPQYWSYPNSEPILCVHAFEFRDAVKSARKFNLGRHATTGFDINDLENTLTALDSALGNGLYLPFDHCVFEFELDSGDPSSNDNGVVVMAEQSLDPHTGRNVIYTRVATLQKKAGVNEYSPAFFYAQGFSFDSSDDQHGFAYYLDDRPLHSDVSDQTAITMLHYPFLCALLALNRGKSAVTSRDAIVSGPRGLAGKGARDRVVFEYKILELDLDAVASIVRHTATSTGRIQARHERRGHKRTLNDGRVVYVRPCVINAGKDVSKVVKSDYALGLSK